MLLKEYRLRHRNDFLRCYAEGEKHVTKHYIIFVCTTSYPYWRLGVTVTKKIGSAVVRNKFRRIIRALFMKYSLAWYSGYDFVVISRFPLDKKKLCLHAIEKELMPVIQARYSMCSHG